MKKEEFIEEKWEEHCALMGTDIDDLQYYAGREVMLKSDFVKAVSEIINTIWFDKDLQK